MQNTQTKLSANLTSPSQRFFNRELSWLEFNARVLHEAMDERNPLLERLKFSGIFSSNLDEFFMVRVSAIKEQVEAGVKQLTPDGRSPEQQLKDLEQRLRPMVKQQHRQFEQELRPAIAAEGIYLLHYDDLSAKQHKFFDDYYERRIFPVLTPLAADPGRPFPLMSNLSLNVAVSVKNPRTGVENFARIKVPDNLPRFIALPAELWDERDRPAVWMGLPMEQVIIHHLPSLFCGMDIQDACIFRITRDADFPVLEDEADDLLIAIEQEISKRHFKGFVVRLEIGSSASTFLKETLTRGLNVEPGDVYEIDGLLNLKDAMSFLGLPLPHLKDAPWQPITPPRLKRVVAAAEQEEVYGFEDGEDIFSAIRQGDILVHHPYESFTDSVQLFITQAADDPDVLAIKMTLYRTSGDSPIVQALIRAAENRKQVAVLMEIKARFDEENNILWARRLEQAGVHVVYGLVGLKTHTKVVLVVRQEGEEINRYMHIGTGNYNPKTARLYTDLGLMSCCESLGADLNDLFNTLTGFSQRKVYRKLLVAPLTLRDRMTQMIQREADHCRNGRPGRIIAKMNALVDPDIITALYEASQAGVEIDLIVRGMCCLKPGIPDLSETIRVISIIGRHLEHSRIFLFGNDGQEEIYIGSADWMPRNLNRRVEAVTPIDDPTLMKELKTLLDIMLEDNRQAWDLQPDGTYVQRRPGEGEEERATHDILMQRAAALGAIA